MTAEVFAIGLRRSNAQLIADLATLGWLRDTDEILDPTFGAGKWWVHWKPWQGEVVTSDANPRWDFVLPLNFLNLPFDDRRFDVVAFDPPYKLNGTPGKTGPASLDKAYGVDGEEYFDWKERYQICCDGAQECARVAKRILLVKCMDQVCSGAVRWQSRDFADAAMQCGFRLADMLHVRGYRPQPKGRSQVHARRDYSTMLVLERVR